MSSRPLPKRTNPLIAADIAPPYEELLARRRLGKTKLSVKPGQIGTSNATKPENLGMFEYAHLRAPLPRDLMGSEIFAPTASGAPPESYFLMRRSKDGYVSATGMFKIAFPWAKYSEEMAEREYLKAKEYTSGDDIAGNVWISPTVALELAEEYAMYPWVKALLDPEEIVQSPASARKHISPPPRFEFPSDRPDLAPPAPTPAKSSRARRSASPSKIASPTKKVASPRKRTTKAMKEANAANAAAASETLQAALETAASEPPQSVEPEGKPGAEEKVKIEVEQNVAVQNGVETTTTNVSVEMPAGSPELPLPEDTEAMIEKAKKMVEEAKQLEAANTSESGKISKKRKAEEPVDGDLDAALPLQPAKKAKVLEEKLKREKVRNRALVGVTATLAIAAAIPYFFV